MFHALGALFINYAVIKKKNEITAPDQCDLLGYVIHSLAFFVQVQSQSFISNSNIFSKATLNRKIVRSLAISHGNYISYAAHPKDEVMTK